MTVDSAEAERTLTNIGVNVILAGGAIVAWIGSTFIDVILAEAVGGEEVVEGVAVETTDPADQYTASEIPQRFITGCFGDMVEVRKVNRGPEFVFSPSSVLKFTTVLLLAPAGPSGAPGVRAITFLKNV